MKCYLCEKKLKRNEVYFGDLGTPLEGKPLCEGCYYDDEICAIVYYGRNEEPYLITETRNETNGDFRVKWHSTDPWRGYFETSSEKYSLVNTAELLAGHESEKMLKQFDERIRELFDEHGIDYARVFARSSNVFYQNYDLYVRKDQKDLADFLVDEEQPEIFTEFVLRSLNNFQQVKVDMVAGWAADKGIYYNVLRRFGFKRHKEVPIICYKTDLCTKIMNQLGKWHFTMADSDNI